MKFKKRTTYSVEHTPEVTPDNPEPQPTELELEQPIDEWLQDELKVHRLPDGTYFLAYLCQDQDVPDPLQDSDTFGKLGTSSRRDRDVYQDIFREALALSKDWSPLVTRNDLLQELADNCNKDWRKLLADPDASFNGRDSLKPLYHKRWDRLIAEHTKNGNLPNPDRVMVDIYEHGRRHYRVSGERLPYFPDMEWDGAYGGAVWVPNESLLEEAKALTGQARTDQMRKWALQAVEITNQWLDGEVFIVEFQHNDAEGRSLSGEYESCGGYYGLDYARQERDNQLKRAIETWNKALPQVVDA